MTGIGWVELGILLCVLGLLVATPIIITVIVVSVSRRQGGGLTSELMQLREENARLKAEIESLKRSQ